MRSCLNTYSLFWFCHPSHAINWKCLTNFKKDCNNINEYVAFQQNQQVWAECSCNSTVLLFSLKHAWPEDFQSGKIELYKPADGRQTAQWWMSSVCPLPFQPETTRQTIFQQGKTTCKLGMILQVDVQDKLPEKLRNKRYFLSFFTKTAWFWSYSKGLFFNPFH